MNFRGIVKKIIPRGLFKKIEPYGHLAETALMQLIYWFPAKNLKIIGVTGTNGKTTTCYLIHRMMLEDGYSIGLMTTVGWGARDQIQPQIEHMTTMPARQLLQRLKHLKKEGVQWVVLEVTSHALGQNRVWGIPISIAVMTNVTHEHLDYHGTFQKYRDAKIKLFKMAASNKNGYQIGVINADDPSAELFAKAIPKSYTYGLQNADIKASDIISTPTGSQFSVRGRATDSPTMSIKINLPGNFNVYNALAAATTGLVLNIETSQIEQGLAALSGVEGRMNIVNEGQDFTVIVDYAHTPDSFERMFAEMRPLIKGKMIVMFGSAGRRDVAKRGILGKIAGKYADIVVVTEEDDRDEDGIKILNQIAKGAQKSGKKKGKNLFLVHNRAEAINFTINKAKSGDTVLLLGKGHEKSIERADGLVQWDEPSIARQAIKNRSSV